MEEMKSRLYLILSLLIFFCLSSCASTPAGEAKDIHNEKKQNHKKLLFEDWKYRGFGQTLPEWFEPAYEDNLVKIKKSVQQLSSCEIVILRGEGINADQAERVMELEKPGVPEGYELYDSFWAMTGEGKYVSLSLYYKEIL